MESFFSLSGIFHELIKWMQRVWERDQERDKKKEYVLSISDNYKQNKERGVRTSNNTQTL